ncbi:VOC family protein [Rhodocytophaga aerolata]|uniref:VOC family protein n=1 Tax=Rhodocytophaga aerolata TaxID=455078 RepID=A0ABT8R049_9BACT|nr:VOC family protein [Rhodocytophaga aerolata]MDO1445471.1 VOC family protein [Rhodocytophaga aerolata]
MQTQTQSSPATGNTLFGKQFAQVAWVVPDIEATAKFFQESMGIPTFFKMRNLRAQELAGTYKGQPADFEFHLYLAYSGDSMLELIQPVSGNSMYQDFLATQPKGGVQHIAYVVAEADFDEAVSQMANRGFPVLQGLHLPVAKAAYFDTYAQIGVVTEVIGITQAGVEFVEQLKRGE